MTTPADYQRAIATDLIRTLAQSVPNARAGWDVTSVEQQPDGVTVIGFTSRMPIRSFSGGEVYETTAIRVTVSSTIRPLETP